MEDASMKEHGIFILDHSASKSSCTIRDHGATILNFHPSPDAGLSEVLFVSRDAVLTGEHAKAIRGGIPLVCPIFGPPSSSEVVGSDNMPQHGFARTNGWTRDTNSVTDTTECASVVYTLAVKGGDSTMASLGTQGLWADDDTKKDVACELRYTITLQSTSLTTKLTVINTGSVAFPLQMLFHTYYEVYDHAALDPTKCFVKGLKGYELVDKVDPELSCASNPLDVITISKETDRVYHPTNNDKMDVKVEIGVGLPHHTIVLTAKGTVHTNQVPISCVVWNPFEAKAKAMGDFGDDQHHDMICVEPGILQPGHVLEAKQSAELEQVIAVVVEEEGI